MTPEQEQKAREYGQNGAFATRIAAELLAPMRPYFERAVAIWPAIVERSGGHVEDADLRLIKAVLEFLDAFDAATDADDKHGLH